MPTSLAETRAWASCSSEPHLIANLRCYFADFPYLLSSTTPKAANLGDLLRSLVRSIMNSQRIHSASLCFSRSNRKHVIPLSKVENAISPPTPSSLIDSIQRICVQILPGRDGSERRSHQNKVAPIPTKTTPSSASGKHPKLTPQKMTPQLLTSRDHPCSANVD